jgi:hypothetical protein
VSSSISRWSLWQDCRLDASGANGEFLAGDYGFHTDGEWNPWWMVDLLEEHLIESVAVVNRKSYSERFQTFQIEISKDSFTWIAVHRQDEPCEVSCDLAAPYEVQFANPCVGRYLRIVLLGRGPLHLRRVQVFGPSASE